MKKFFLLFLLALAFLAVPAEEACAKKVGAWTVGQLVDEMDDSVTLYAHTKSEEGCYTDLGLQKHPLLILSGAPQKLFMCSVVGLPWIGTESDIELAYRIDKGKVKNITGFAKKDNVYFFNMESFAKDLYGHKTLLVRIRASSGSHTVKFNISGAREALKDIAKAAGWQ